MHHLHTSLLPPLLCYPPHMPFLHFRLIHMELHSSSFPLFFLVSSFMDEFVSKLPRKIHHIILSKMEPGPSNTLRCTSIIPQSSNHSTHQHDDTRIKSFRRIINHCKQRHWKEARQEFNIILVYSLHTHVRIDILLRKIQFFDFGITRIKRRCVDASFLSGDGNSDGED